MTEFWVASGHHLARRRRDGWLEVTDELLLAWLARPEVMPPVEACAAERALHARLTAEPRAAVGRGEVAALADADARENWAFLLGFRDRLLATGTIEGAYLDIVGEGAALPPLFLDQLVHLLMRSALDGCADPFTLRAAELFWRPQRAGLRDGALVLADAEVAKELQASAAAAPLIALFGAGGVDSLDLMTPENAWTYWSRSDAHTMALDWGGAPQARQGLARAIAAYLRHLLGIEAEIEALTEALDADFRWFVGLDAEGTALGNALWRGDRPEGADRLIGIFRMRIAPRSGVDRRIAEHAVWLLLGMTPDRVVRMKPQNLVAGLPLAPAARAV
jgi:Family of unknown function (DUF6352)